MKAERDVGVDANAEVVVHDEYLGVVLVRVGLVDVDVDAYLLLRLVHVLVLVRVEHDGPAI